MCEAQTLVIVYILSSHRALTAFVILSRKLSFEISRIMPTHTRGPWPAGGQGGGVLALCQNFPGEYVLRVSRGARAPHLPGGELRGG